MKSLVLMPALVTLAVTLLRLAGINTRDFIAPPACLSPTSGRFVAGP